MTDKPVSKIEKLLDELTTILDREVDLTGLGTILAGMIAYWLFMMPKRRRRPAHREHVAETRRIMSMSEDRVKKRLN